MNKSLLVSSQISRRGFFSVAGATALTVSLAACAAGGTGGGGSGAGVLKFWDMPWGSENYVPEAETLAKAFTPPTGLPSATYQQVLWNGFNETFASAIASKTGPAVSTGGGFQAFQFAKQGAIAYADNLIESLKKDGLYDDFLPDTVEALKTPDGYVAVPWALDPLVMWYRKSILDAIGAAVPTTWDELLAAGKKAAAKGYYGFGISGGNGVFGPQAVLSFMINNGGGLFTDTGDLNVLTDRNIEAAEFVMELVKSGLTDPGASSLKDDDLTNQWRDKKIAMGFFGTGLNEVLGDDDVLVADPLKGPHGDVGGLQYVNNIMMYTNTPSQEDSEAFVTYYLKNMKTLWEKKSVSLIPALKSIAALPEFNANPQNTAIVKKWLPVCKTTAAKSSTLSAAIASIDGGQAMTDFAQTLMAAKTSGKAALLKLEGDIQSVLS